MPCSNDGDCLDPANPLCHPVSARCVGCQAIAVVEAQQDAACAQLDPDRPRCVDGTCEACETGATEVCEAQGLLCDEQAHVCAPCTRHEQCPSGACHLAEGTCFPADVVFNVDPDHGYYPAFQPAMLAIAVMDLDYAVLVVHEPDDGSWWPANLSIDGGLTLAIIAARGDSPTLQGLGGAPTVSVHGTDTTLYLQGVRVLGNNAADGLVVTDGSLWMDRTVVANNQGRGLVVDDALAWVERSELTSNDILGVSCDNAQVHVRRSRIVNNTGDGVLASNGCLLHIENSFVGRNGDGFTDTRGITATDSIVRVVYTTIAANDGDGATGPISISCNPGTSGEVRNSIIASGDDTIGCAGVDFDFNVLDTAGLGATNDVLSFDSGWFPGFAASDFHVVAGTPFTNVAQWQDGGPIVDIDGDPRPTVDGTPDYAGADAVP